VPDSVARSGIIQLSGRRLAIAAGPAGRAGNTIARSLAVDGVEFPPLRKKGSRIMFKKGEGSWTQYRAADVMEVDFHPCRHDCHPDDREEGHMPYWEKMATVYSDALKALEVAYESGVKWVLFTHGHSTSRPGNTTSRSVIRGLMRSKKATPYILRRLCEQHKSAFLAAIRPKPETPPAQRSV
jgi:hypothetical protein